MTCYGSDPVSLKDLLTSEREYFEPMIARESRSTKEHKEEWARETVRERHERVSEEVYELCNREVKYGPFKGMRLSSKRWWGSRDRGSQCLGLYEKEVLDIIKVTPAKGWNTFIDIGAADGYYAIGMLSSGLARHAISYELSEEGQATVLDNWELNDSAGTLASHSEATLASLEATLPRDLVDSLVLIDIEGAEFALLSDKVLKLLSGSTVIVEIHNWVDDFTNKYSELLTRLDKWFQIAPIDRTERPTFHLAELRDLTDDNRLLLTSESRPCVMRFLKLTPKKDA